MTTGWLKGLCAVRLCLCVAAFLVAAGCQAPPAAAPPPPPKPIVLTDIPTYHCSRTDWVGGTACMVYPCYGAEDHVGLSKFQASLKMVLRQEGYEVVEMETYMSPEARARIDKIIRPIQYSPRSVTNNAGEIIWDLMVIVSVENRQTDVTDIDKRPPRRLFQVWTRNIWNVPTHEAAQALMRVDGFREALEPAGASAEQPAA